MPKLIEFLGYNPVPLGTSFADRIRHSRRALGLNLVEFAALIGVPANTIHCWEQRGTQPGNRRMERVLALLERLCLAG